MFADRDKLIFRVNAYACWIVAWLGLNHVLAANHYLGLTYYTLPIPMPLYQTAIAIAVLTTAASLWALKALAYRLVLLAAVLGLPSALVGSSGWVRAALFLVKG